MRRVRGRFVSPYPASMNGLPNPATSPRSRSSSASSTHQTKSARESKARSRSRRCSTPVQAHSAERGLIRHQHQPGYLTSEGDEHLRRNGRARSRGACRTCRRLRALERGCLPRGRWHTVRHLTVEECRSEERLQANRGPAHGKGFGAGANEVGSGVQTLEESAIFKGAINRTNQLTRSHQAIVSSYMKAPAAPLRFPAG